MKPRPGLVEWLPRLEVAVKREPSRKGRDARRIIVCRRHVDRAQIEATFVGTNVSIEYSGAVMAVVLPISSHTLRRQSFCRISACLVVVLGLMFGVAASASQEPPDDEHSPTEAPGLPEIPAGAVRLVNHARHGGRVAICAEEPGPQVKQGDQLIPRTQVWVHDGVKIRKIGTAPGTCDPAWSPDGDQVAVVAPNGLWLMSADLTMTTHLVDTRHSDSTENELVHRTLSEPKWAPDASRLAFLVSTGPTSWVETVDARTGQIVHSSDPEIYEFAWGADSRSLRLGSQVIRLP